MNERKIIGKRKEIGLTQEDVAKKIGISITSYNMKEKGKREFTASELQKISVILNVPVSYFFEN